MARASEATVTTNRWRCIRARSAAALTRPSHAAHPLCAFLAVRCSEERDVVWQRAPGYRQQAEARERERQQRMGLHLHRVPPAADIRADRCAWIQAAELAEEGA